jgi:DNA helicase-2/ATP-dependent DNA helicase PcrA
VKYTDDQQSAIDCLDRPLQIVACAGSGKTQVISARIAQLLARDDVEPANVVAFTFTEKAAAELKDRVLTLVEQTSGTTVGLAEMYIGTMHAYALNLLQTYVPESFKYSVLDEIRARLFIDRNSIKSGLTTCPTVSPGTPTLRRYINTRLYLRVLGVLREDQVDVTHVSKGVLDSTTDYLSLLSQHAYFDYPQMLLAAVGLLEGDADHESAAMLHTHIERDIRFVVVDEYQDCNPLQERLIAGLCQYGANLCVVGDDDQTIYQWRGSEVRNILSFAERIDDVQTVTLAHNYRSSKGVVEVGRSVAELVPVDERLPKRMVSAGNQTYERGDLLALTFDTGDDEAAWICDRIIAMRGTPFKDSPGEQDRGLSWSDFSVLFRSVARDADSLVNEMRRRDIPFVVKGLNRLFDSPEIQAVVKIFQYMVATASDKDLHQAWEDADLIPDADRWAAAVAVLDRGRDWDRGKRWGVYNIQRLYLEFLEKLELREETISDPTHRGRGELVMYQLGKFSQAISDFEQIYFATSPYEKYTSFEKWLVHRAPDYYAESDEDSGYAQPDAVSISTVHQAKGMQWPAVFVPCLRRNRFPSRRQGGLGLFHVIPDVAISDPDRYRGRVQDEARLFYVALTRAQKWLFCSHSPGSGQYKVRSSFFDHLTRQSWMLTRDPGLPADAGSLTATPKRETPQVTLSFTELKHLFECPYQFKLRFLYGFNPPLHEALGYGKGLHDALSEVHKRFLAGEIVGTSASESLVDRHLHTPFAYPALRESLHRSAVEAVERYLREQGDVLAQTLHSEKQIQVHVAPGITVDGRIDLIRRLDTDEVSIVDFKSTARAQDEEVTRDQLHVYALGYEELTGERADVVEILNLDEEGKSQREVVDRPLITSVQSRMKNAGEALRTNELPRLVTWCGSCASCDLVGICRNREE